MIVILSTESQINTIRNTISDYYITTEEIEAWKTSNKEEYESLIINIK